MTSNANGAWPQIYGGVLWTDRSAACEGSVQPVLAITMDRAWFWSVVLWKSTHRITSSFREGNTTPGAVAWASCALAVGHAEQAASQSKAAGQVPEMHDDPDQSIRAGINST